MARRMMPLLGTLVAGIAVGLLSAMIYLQAQSSTVASHGSSTPAADNPSLAASNTPDQAAYNNRLQYLEAQLQEFRQRTSALESKIEHLSSRFEALAPDVAVVGLTASESDTGDSPDTNDASETQTAIRTLTVSTLVDIGVDEQLARDVIRREGDREMQRLELRDQAIRDGSFGTEAYFQTLQALNDDRTALREEVGDSAYDRYLYTTNQPNRVLISSVIPGSPAEQAGIQTGDIILGYAEQRIFNWSELREATTQGERGEYVQVNIQRASTPVSLLLPRGPLGVRLDSTREAPIDP